MDPASKKTFTLLEICSSLERMIAEKYSSVYWIKAEMNKLNYYQSSGHSYPDLVQKENGKIIAQIRAIIWSSDFEIIKAKFLKATHEKLKDGIKILFCARINYNRIHGLSLQILDIDPAYSLGELEMEKQETISTLKNEGLFNRNKELAFPALPSRIAVISVETSKGYRDFLNIIQEDGKGFGIFHFLFPSILQGDKAIEGILEQLKRIRKVLHHFDTVAIIRGGGGDIGLASFNDYRLCREIALFPLPVLTGIGHATNETVAEMVSHRNSITPTDLANFLLRPFLAYASQLDQHEKSIIQKARQILQFNHVVLKDAGRNLHLVTRNKVLVNRNIIDMSSPKIDREIRYLFQLLADKTNRYKDRISTATKNILQIDKVPALKQNAERLNRLVWQILKDEKKDLSILDQRTQAMDPINVLKRGFTITRVNGRTVRSIHDLEKGDQISTQTTDGTITSTVNETHSNL